MVPGPCGRAPVSMGGAGVPGHLRKAVGIREVFRSTFGAEVGFKTVPKRSPKRRKSTHARKHSFDVFLLIAQSRNP